VNAHNKSFSRREKVAGGRMRGVHLAEIARF
jgi:hypothetical protein